MLRLSARASAAALVLVLLLLCGTAAAQEAEPLPETPRSAAPDTLQRSVAAGEVLILQLPDAELVTPLYSVVRVPALSLLEGRAFFWRTLPQDAGRHELLFGRRLGEAAPDTLRLVVEVTE